MAKFSVRARAVDMLGQQQIAGIPTAIHELFKNAHDAYATRVEVDFFRTRQVLVIRDNGLGMTEEDFRGKWLALGTESKFKSSEEVRSRSDWTGPENLPTRPILGEKGIGRLAIATIAPIVFVMSRAVRPDRLHDVVACLVYWPLFELPGLDISDIEIPVETFPKTPNAEAFEKMVDAVKANIESIVPNQTTAEHLIDQISNCQFDLDKFEAWFANLSEEIEEPDLSLSGNNYGTHFYLFHTNRMLEADIGEDHTNSAPPIKRVLLGFSNTMDPEYLTHVKTEFRDHQHSGNFDELIDRDQFFSADDLKKADHLFEGEFDEYGQFRGSFCIYREEPEEYVLSWPEARGTPTECGPFKLRLSVIQGLQSESVLDPETWGILNNKTRRYGGLYVYRDGVRVLPYGLPDFDWLKIEYRRTLSAQDHFFSHRRMAGYIALDSNLNGALSEKAGREGFRENRAYRQLRSILENWLQQVVKDYFRKDAGRGDTYRQTLDIKRREASLLKKRRKQVGKLKAEFRNRLQEQFEKIENQEFEKRIQELVDQVSKSLLALTNSPTHVVSAESLKQENQAITALDLIAEQISISRPRFLSLTKREIKAYEDYTDWLKNFETTVLESTRSKITQLAETIREENEATVSKTERARVAIYGETERTEKNLRDLHRNAKGDLDALNNAVLEALSRYYSGFSDHLENIKSNLERIDFDGLPANSAMRKQRDIELSIIEEFERRQENLKALSHQLVSLEREIKSDTLPDELLSVLEGRVRELEDQLALYNDLAQAGGAVGIVSHEMENVISGLRAAIRGIKPWADGTPDLYEVYERLRTYFDHLDSFVGLFSPLSRRVRRKRVKVTGESILSYVQELFESRLKDENIELIVTKSFTRKTLTTFRSTLIAAVVNIIDNAIYWIGSDRNSSKWIRLDADEQGLLIENGGPGVPLRLARNIFEFGFSLKPGGRGMGLTVSRDALEAVGLTLQLLTPGTEKTPVFRICPTSEEEV